MDKKEHYKQLSPVDLRMIPMGQYEYVDVEFIAADTDTVIPTTLLPEDPYEIRFMDIVPQDISGTIGTVYKSNSPSAQRWGTNYIVLRSTLAGHTTRLLLFLER